MGMVGAITSVPWILFTTSWNRLEESTFGTPGQGREPKSELQGVEYTGWGRDASIVAPNSDEVAAVGRALLRGQSEVGSGTGIVDANGTSTSILFDPTAASAWGDSLDSSDAPLSPFFTALRITSSSSLARLFTTGGVDENAWKSAAISAGGCSTNLNRKRFDNTYLNCI